MIILSGSALAVNWADEHIPAIIQGWYPGAQGGRAIAKVLFGDKNPEGKLPVTFYRTTEELPEFTDYNMKNRTYRYMKNEALYPFGYGLSYTSFTYSNQKVSHTTLSEDGITVSATLTNDGSREGTETVQIYVKADRAGTPNAQLKGIRKVNLKPGESKEVSVKLPLDAFGLYDEQAVKRVEAGKYLVSIGGSQPEHRSEELTGKKVGVIEVSANKEYTIY